MKIIKTAIKNLYDYIFDLRKNSPTYKRQVKINLKQDMSQIIFVPKGCAHGFLTKKKILLLYIVSLKIITRIVILDLITKA